MSSRIDSGVNISAFYDEPRRDAGPMLIRNNLFAGVGMTQDRADLPAARRRTSTRFLPRSFTSSPNTFLMFDQQCAGVGWWSATTSCPRLYGMYGSGVGRHRGARGFARRVFDGNVVWVRPNTLGWIESRVSGNAYHRCLPAAPVFRRRGQAPSPSPRRIDNLDATTRRRRAQALS
jgi:hypothetical protein